MTSTRLNPTPVFESGNLGTSATYARYGKVVVVLVQGRANDGNKTYASAGTLPEGCRPSRYYAVPMSPSGYIDVGTNGSVHVYREDSGTAYGYANMVFTV